MSQNRKGFKMKKLKFLLATLVFLLIVLVCSQVNAAAPDRITNVYDLANFLNEFGGNVKYEGNTVTLQHDVNATTDLYIYTTGGNELTIDLNGYQLDFTHASDSAKNIWGNTAENFTITDSSNKGTSVVRTNKGSLISYNSSNTLTIENTSLVGMWSATDPLFISSGTSTTNLKNVKITTYGTAIAAQENVKYNLENVSFNMGGMSYEYVIKLSGDIEAILKNCNFKSTGSSGRFIWINSALAKAIIDGGSYSYEGNNTSEYLLYNDKGTLEIKDGTFKNQEGTVVRTIDGTTTISGGAFDGKGKTITTTSGTTLTLKGGYFKARSDTSEPGAAIGFSMSKTMDDIIADGYFATNTETRTNSGFRLTGPEVCVYAKPNSITFDKTDFTYNGKDQAPTAIVKDTEGKTLQYGTDYIVEYPTNRKDVGEYKATVKFIDRYETIPSKELSYKINKATYDMSKFKFDNKKVTYNGKNKSITAAGIPEGLKVTYLNNNKKKVGEYKVTAHFEVDTKNYNPVSDKTATLTIIPKGTSISKLKAGKKQFKATWKKQKTQTTGYEIQYSTNSKFKSGNKKVKIKKNKTTSTTVKKLKGKKKYYVRIRTYKTVNGKKICSEWSKSKKVTTKK